MKLFIFCFILFSPCLQAQTAIKQLSGSHEEVFNFIKPLLPKKAIILECGGYDGTDTSRMATIWPLSRIYTFEPIPQNFLNLIQKTKNCSNVKAFQLALADCTGKLEFYVSDFNNAGTPGGSSSLLPPKDHLKFDQSVTFNTIIHVDAISLDDWSISENIDHIDFMSLDMQGFELNMLKASAFAKKTRLIYTEVEFIEAYAGQYLYPDIKNWMEENGFKLIALDFDESLGLLGKKGVKPGNGKPYFGNALFYNTAYKSKKNKINL